MCGFCVVLWFFFFKQKTAYEMLRSLVGSEMCIRDRPPSTARPRPSDTAGCCPPRSDERLHSRLGSGPAGPPPAAPPPEAGQPGWKPASVDRGRLSAPHAPPWRNPGRTRTTTTQHKAADPGPRHAGRGTTATRLAGWRGRLPADRASVLTPGRRTCRPRPRRTPSSTWPAVPGAPPRRRGARGPPARSRGRCRTSGTGPVSYTHLRAHETPEHLVCRLLLE